MTHHENTEVREAMTSGPAVVQASTTAAEAARTMKDENVGSLPVVEDGRLVGMVTDRDLALRVLGEGREPGVAVSEVCASDLVTIDPAQTLAEAARLMADHQLRRLPVVEEDGRLVGIVAQADIARHGDDALTGEVVQKISGSE
jgi:CBS domain-containing protein